MSPRVNNGNEIWVFGDWRNYFQNRVTLQLLARARDLAGSTGGEVCALVFGHNVEEWVGEYVAHGADKVYVVDHPRLANYSAEAYTYLLVDLAQRLDPAMVLVGATDFGRELAARTAKRLRTGLTADCIGLHIDDEGRFVQTAPAFGGNLLAACHIPGHRPAMATVRPGTFAELAHDDERTAEVVRLELPKGLGDDRVRVVTSQPMEHREESLETAKVVVCGGRGMSSKQKFKNLHTLAGMLGGEVGATRPVVFSGWAPEDSLVGQAGRHIKPKLLLSFGVSGAIQHTAGIIEADFIVAVNKNPAAAMMKMADVAIVADANQVCLALMRELRQRLG